MRYETALAQSPEYQNEVANCWSPVQRSSWPVNWNKEIILFCCWGSGISFRGSETGKERCPGLLDDGQATERRLCIATASSKTSKPSKGATRNNLCKRRALSSTHRNTFQPSTQLDIHTSLKSKCLSISFPPWIKFVSFKWTVFKEWRWNGTNSTTFSGTVCCFSLQKSRSRLF